ncbi:hypothetical protein DSO57_1025193 [Entomophthora muscae]|uniref:Uncharacterized protein n=1 Tax=Entomophthora muscae TaxID=34485 RepID=A0ACC2UMX0_9FUNG|nr:hypothetical protein DSO57_1025193 [Entomophthora muscae]
MLFFQYGSVVVLLTIPGLLTRYVRKLVLSSCLCWALTMRLHACQEQFSHNLLAFFATGTAVALFHRKARMIDSTLFSKASVNERMCATYQILGCTNTLRACAFDARSSLLYLHFQLRSTRSDSRFFSIASWVMSFDVNSIPRCLKERCGSIDVMPAGGGKLGNPILTIPAGKDQGAQ